MCVFLYSCSNILSQRSCQQWCWWILGCVDLCLAQVMGLSKWTRGAQGILTRNYLLERGSETDWIFTGLNSEQFPDSLGCSKEVWKDIRWWKGRWDYIGGLCVVEGINTGEMPTMPFLRNSLWRHLPLETRVAFPWTMLVRWLRKVEPIINQSVRANRSPALFITSLDPIYLTVQM